MKTLIIVIVILLAVLTTPLTIKRAIDRGRYTIKPPGEKPGVSTPSASATDKPAAGSTDSAVPDAGSPAGPRAAFAELNPGLNKADWERIFVEAEERKVEFVFLVGGDPLLHRDVLEQAGEHDSILFPISIRGAITDNTVVRLFDRCPNLLPVFSLPGSQTNQDGQTNQSSQLSSDPRRGSGMPPDIPFGVSITITTQNLREATERGFLTDLCQNGCRLVLYKEYVAGDESIRGLEPGEADRALMELRLQDLQDRGIAERIGSTDAIGSIGMTLTRSITND